MNFVGTKKKDEKSSNLVKNVKYIHKVIIIINILSEYLPFMKLLE